MNATTQQILAAVAVIAALLYLILRARKKKACGGGCDCGPKKPQGKEAGVATSRGGMGAGDRMADAECVRAKSEQTPPTRCARPPARPRLQIRLLCLRRRCC